jgi:type I restriction enzyme, S subunit
MTDLPPDWEWTTVQQVADVAGGIQKGPHRKPVENAYPMLRVANVYTGRLDLDEVHEVELFDGELERLRLKGGDSLVVEGNGSIAQVGRAAMWTDAIPNCVHQNHILRARPLIEPTYMSHWLQSPGARDQIERVASSTSGLHVLSGRKLKALELPIAPKAEQERIVAAIEEHLSRLDAAEAQIQVARRRAVHLRRGLLAQAQAMGDETTLGELLVSIEAGKSFKTPGHVAEPDQWGVIKVSAMTWGEFRESENKAVLDERSVQPRYEIHPGDLLLSRANTSEYVGASVLVGHCRPKLLLSDKSMRLHPTEDVDKRWLFLALSSPHMRAQMSLVASGTSDSMRNISQEKVRALRLRVPPLDQQRALADQITHQMEGASTSLSGIDAASRRTAALRRAILAAAFSGRLVPQNPDDEPAAVLLERIRAERATAGPAPRRRTRGAASP